MSTCLIITQNISFKFFNFSNFHQILSINIDLSGNTVWQYTSDFRNLLNWPFWAFFINFFPLKCDFFRNLETLWFMMIFKYFVLIYLLCSIASFISVKLCIIGVPGCPSCLNNVSQALIDANCTHFGYPIGTFVILEKKEENSNFPPFSMHTDAKSISFS